MPALCIALTKVPAVLLLCTDDLLAYARRICGLGGTLPKIAEYWEMTK